MSLYADEVIIRCLIRSAVAAAKNENDTWTYVYWEYNVPDERYYQVSAQYREEKDAAIRALHDAIRE